MGTDRHTHSQPSLYPVHHHSPQTNMKTLLLAVIPMVIFAMVDAQYGRGGCDWRECRNNRYLAQRCCSSSGTCCDFANGGGNYGVGYNNGGQGYNPGYNNGGYNPGYGNSNGYNNNNGGSCIRDSDCSADLKCCYLRSGYQCTSPLGNYFG